MSIRATFTRSLIVAAIAAAGASLASMAVAVKVGPVEDPIRVVKIAKGEPIVIGEMWVLSGSEMALGVDVHRAVEIAIDDVGGEIEGHPIRLISEDDQCSAEGGQTAASKLASNQQVILVVGSACSSVITPGAPILWKAGIPSIGIGSSPTLTAPDRPEGYHGFLRTAFNDLVTGARVAEYVRDELKFDKVATIHDGSPYTQNLVAVFKDNFEKLGGEVCAAEAIAPTDIEMRPVLTRLASCKPKLIYLPLFVAATGHVARQAREIDGLKGTILLGSNSAVTKDMIEVAGEAIIGFRFETTAMEFDAQGTGYLAFRERYNDKYGEYPIHGFHQMAYDAAMIGLLGIKKVIVTDDADNAYVPINALRAALYATKNYDGLTGNLTCDQYGDCGFYNIGVYEYVNSDADTFEVGVNPIRVYP